MIYIIGDSHIGLGDGAERRISDWIDRLIPLRPTALYLNGDLFHYLIAHRNFRTSAVEKVMQKFAQLRDSGAQVHYVEGNRDFFLKGSFVEDFVTDVAFEFAISAGAHRYVVVHGDMINDRVDVIEIGPGGLVCRDAPFVARGEIVELVIEDGDNSYRFRARGVWLRDDGDHYRVGLAFVGMPVCLHKVQISPHTQDVVDKIANAA